MGQVDSLHCTSLTVTDEQANLILFFQIHILVISYPFPPTSLRKEWENAMYTALNALICCLQGEYKQDLVGVQH